MSISVACSLGLHVMKLLCEFDVGGKMCVEGFFLKNWIFEDFGLFFIFITYFVTWMTTCLPKPARILLAFARLFHRHLFKDCKVT